MSSDQPTNQDTYCTALDVDSGEWYSRVCNTAKPYVCKVPPRCVPSVSTTPTPLTKCSDGWTYVDGPVGKCLGVCFVLILRRSFLETMLRPKHRLFIR